MIEFFMLYPKKIASAIFEDIAYLFYRVVHLIIPRMVQLGMYSKIKKCFFIKSLYFLIPSNKTRLEVPHLVVSGRKERELQDIFRQFDLRLLAMKIYSAFSVNNSQSFRVAPRR